MHRLLQRNMHAEFTPSHLLKALLHKETGLQQLLKTLRKDIYYLEEWADVRIEAIEKSPSFSDTVVGITIISEVMNEADSIGLKLSKDAIEPAHVLAALITPCGIYV